MARLLVIMGSGETAPTMVKPHRAIFERIGSGGAAILDTPYGFQTNADDISARAVTYFKESVGRGVDVVSWRGRDISGVARERAIGALHSAAWVFAGPGSPTYTLRHWRDTPVPNLLAERLTEGGAVVFASAAALTLGSHTIPVYEIYKAGVEPGWAQGLDLVHQVTGLPAVVIPHYDNAEGGHHDTRYAYLGESRLSMMELELPAETFILGVDEHTAVVLDLEARTASVLGNGTMTIRQHGRSIVHPSGAVVAFDTLTAGVVDAPPVAVPAPSSAGRGGSGEDTSLRAAVDRLAGRFGGEAESGDAEACVETALELEQVQFDWSADTDVEDAEHTRAVLRQMVVRLGDLARAGQTSDAALGPLMDVVLSIRSNARAAKDYATSDLIRDRLAALDIEVRDTPDGAEWLRQAR